MTPADSSQPPDHGLGWLDPARTYDAAMRLLGRQLIDPDGRLAGKADDLEITYYPDGSAAITAILTGPGAWADGMPGFLGRWTTAVWRRLHPDTDPQPTRILLDDIADVERAGEDEANRLGGESKVLLDRQHPHFRAIIDTGE